MLHLRLLFQHALVALCLGPIFAHSAPNHEPVRKSVTAAARVGTITIDGRLDEAAWAQATASGGFIERSPNPGAAPPVDDSVRILYDDEAVYLGVRLGAEPGEPPEAMELRRDNFRIFSDDAVTLKFDVTAERRSTVGFGVNVAGARIDYVAVSSFRIEYDALWEVATQVTDTGWNAEFRIPYVALGLQSGDAARLIGLQISHDHRARTATYDWSEMPPEFGPVAAIKYGNIEGIRAAGVGTPIAMIPYVLGKKTNETNLEGQLGGDLRLRIGEETFLELTALTDFAEVDLDDPQVNFDRFQLFIAEKRPFFLSGLNVFEFGATAEAQVFFSRRVGLDADAQPIPVWAGTKLYGRQGKLSFGVLNVLTGQDGEAQANHSVARVRYDVGDTRVGAIASVNTPLATVEGQDRPAVSVGADGQYRGGDGKRFETKTFAAVSLPSSDGAKPGMAGAVSARWLGKEWTPRIRVLRVGEAFAPTDGFARRTELLKTTAQTTYVHRYTEGPLRSISSNINARLDTDANATALQGNRLGSWAQLTSREGFRLGTSVSRKNDRVRDSFKLLERLDVDADEYNSILVDAWLMTPSTINPDGSLYLAYTDGYFGGQRWGTVLRGSVSATRHVRLRASVEWSRVRLPGQPTVDSLVLNSGLTLAPSSTLFVDLTGQTNQVANQTASIARMRWRYLPGSDLFVVYRRQDDAFATLANDAQWSLTFKISLRRDFAL